jgi:hypothetical protein
MSEERGKEREKRSKSKRNNNEVNQSSSKEGRGTRKSDRDGDVEDDTFAGVVSDVVAQPRDHILTRYIEALRLY